MDASVAAVRGEGLAHARAEHIACRCRTGKRKNREGRRSQTQLTVTFAGMKVMARSASAAIVSDGLTPGLADTAEPSIT